MSENSDPEKLTDFVRSEWRGRNVTVMGLGRFGGGVAVVRFLVEAGATVSVTDLASHSQLQTSLDALSDVKVAEYVLEEHPARLFTDCDTLVVNPAVRPNHELVELAVASGAEVSSEIELFCRYCPAEIIGVTGSNGKSTTASLTHHLLQRGMQDGRRVWLGGNIGVSLLPHLNAVSQQDVVVLELSSFQLTRLVTRRFRPRIAIITNFSANHLDWHGTVESYQAAKRGLLAAQQRDDAAVLPDSFDLTDWKPRGSVLRFGLMDEGEDGAHWEDDVLILRGRKPPETWFASPRSAGSASRPDTPAGPGPVRVEEAVRIPIPTTLYGAHNRKNVAAAACAAWLWGVDVSTLPSSVRSFPGLPHRFSCVAEHNGRRFIDDSIATTPDSVIAALETLGSSVIILAGGYDKGACLSEMAKVIARKAKAAFLMGQTASILEEAILSEPDRSCRTVQCGRDFDDTFLQAVALSEPGDIVLLSPGCASFGWFRDFRDRGEQFTALVNQWMSES